MGYTITEKILKKNSLNFEDLKNGANIKIRVDQTLTQDATGTMAYLQLEALGISRVKTKLSVAYIDHNTLQNGFMNADDHRYIASVAKKYGIYYSKPGNGICHQVHLERFAVPGEVLIGSDSHTPTAGGIGMLSFGAGGFDVACAMAGYPYEIACPKIVKVNLNGSLRPFVSAKDIILKILGMLTVKGGVGKIFEYGGDGLRCLSVPERATITNMGAELGATTSIFPSDDITFRFLRAQGRGDSWVALEPDGDAKYSEVIEINLDELEPMVACPHSPDNVKPVKEVAGLKVDQVCIGSCTNSSLVDMIKVATILRGKKVARDVDLVLSFGSKQVLGMLSKNGMLSDIIDAGARMLENACGPCIGMGQSPRSGGVSLRTFNRNFLGRSGTKDAKIYLVSPEVAAYSAIKGELCLPNFEEFDPAILKMPQEFFISDVMICPPAGEEEAKNLSIEKGPNIKPFPVGEKLDLNLKSTVVLKVGDNITTDDIMPAGAKILPFRSNIPYISQFCFEALDKDFAKRAKEAGSGVIVGGVNYGQGSSREHAALVPLYLGVKVIIAKSFARIHRANLINAGIVPLLFEDEIDYERVFLGERLEFIGLKDAVEKEEYIVVTDGERGISIKARICLNKRERDIILAGGVLKYIKGGNN